MGFVHSTLHHQTGGICSWQHVGQLVSPDPTAAITLASGKQDMPACQSVVQHMLIQWELSDLLLMHCTLVLIVAPYMVVCVCICVGDI